VKFVIAITAKEESKSFPYKNHQVIGDTPLYGFCLETATKVKSIMEEEGHEVVVVMDSDSAQYRAYAVHHHGADILVRPKQLTKENITGDHLAVWEALNYRKHDVLVQLSPICPFTKWETIVTGLSWFIENEVPTSLVGASFTQVPMWIGDYYNFVNEDGTLKHHKKLDGVMAETTGLYMAKIPWILKHNRRASLNPKDAMFITQTPIERILIRTKEDLELARIVWKGLTT